MEEIRELNDAFAHTDLPEVLDALVDLVYVAISTAWLLNLPFDQAWQAVHAANMAKIRVENASQSKRKHAFDIVKPAGWQPPDHSNLLDKADLGLIKLRPQATQQLDLIDWINDQQKTGEK